MRKVLLACLIGGLVLSGCDGTRLYPDWFGGKRRKHHPVCPPPSPAPPPLVDTAPVAALSVDKTSGALSSVFHVDASGSWDTEDPTSKLEVRWDWEDDGTFDTAFSATKTAAHAYSREGAKRIRVEVRDPGGLTTQATRTVTVGTSASDVNGDGYADLVVGAPDHEGSSPGKVYVFFGGPTLTGRDLSVGDQADAVLTGQASDEIFGTTLVVGDVNGDGLGDICVGATDADVGGADSGSVYVFFGSSTFSSRDLGQSGVTADITIVGPAPYDQLGYTLAVGDLNDDGTDDLVVGAPHESASGTLTNGRVYVFFGGSNLADLDLSSGGPADATFNGATVLDTFGLSLATGDVNDDGVADLLVGAAHQDTGAFDAGAVYVFYGGAGLTGVDLATGGAADAAFFGQGSLDEFGFLSLEGSDVTGDGVADVVVGCYLNDAGGSNSGRVYVFRGSATLSGKNLASGDVADVTLTGAAGDTLGNFMACADVNGDGTSDVVVSGVGNDAGGTDAGRAYVFFGGPGLSDTNLSTGDSADVIVTGAAAFDLFGYVAGGDVDGDGTPDLIVGAIWNDAGGPQAGRVYVFKGPNLSNVDLSAGGSADLTFTGPGGTTRFGHALSP